MVREVQTWLEAEVDRGRRRELASARAGAGREALNAYRAAIAAVTERQREVKEFEATVEGWQPIAEKSRLFAAEDRLAASRRAVVVQSAVVVETFERALEYDPSNNDARAGLADYYWLRFVAAEEAGDEQAEFFSQRLRQYHDGRYAHELEGTGALTLACEPPAEVLLYELAPSGLVLVPEHERRLGPTPLTAVPLAMGSYLAILRREGYRDARYPIWISRNRHWQGAARLFTDAEIGSGFVHVPAGPFVQGGDPDCRGWALPRAEPLVPDYFITVHPVTAAEYLDFLNDLARREGLDAAKARGPRAARDAPTYCPEDGAGGLTIPPPPWRDDLPALAVSRDDADAYCRWRSERDGRPLRLPTEPEWEKAARGVDGRWFPWGWKFDPSLCNMALSQREQAIPVSIHEFPTDISIYGVRGMAGNARDWTATTWDSALGGRAHDTVVIRGGAWAFNPIDSRCAYRNRIQPWAPNDNFSFRLAADPLGPER